VTFCRFHNRSKSGSKMMCIQLRYGFWLYFFHQNTRLGSIFWFIPHRKPLYIWNLQNVTEFVGFFLLFLYYFKSPTVTFRSLKLINSDFSNFKTEHTNKNPHRKPLYICRIHGEGKTATLVAIWVPWRYSPCVYGLKGWIPKKNLWFEALINSEPCCINQYLSTGQVSLLYHV
jgi:hypothetical protein